MQKLLALSGLATAAALARSGEDVHCVGDRAHVLKYDIKGEENDGSSMKGVESAIISFDAARHLDQQCLNSTLRGDETPSGDKQLCYGVNQNSDCSGADKTIQVANGALECKDCYVAVKADAFYSLNYSMGGLNSAQVGLKDIHLTASASLHKTLSGSTTAFKGSHEFANADRKMTLIDKLVGCPICVKAKVVVAVPTTLDYQLDLSATTDITAGASVDAHMADRWAKYDSKDGWTYPEYKLDVTTKPFLTVDNTDAKANLNLGLRTSVQIELDDIVWYHLDIHPTFPLKAEISSEASNPLKPKFCLKGDGDMTIAHEANLDWKVLAWHAKNHWGPTQDKDWSKSGVIDFCKDLKAEAEMVV